MRTLSDFPLGSVWARVDLFGSTSPILVIDYYTAVEWCPQSIDYFVYLCLATGHKHYCLKGSRDFEHLTRLA